MQVIVYGFGQATTDAAHFYEVIDARSNHALQTAKLAQQFAPFLRPESRSFLEARGGA
jgi:hypothetical protein